MISYAELLDRLGGDRDRLATDTYFQEGADRLAELTADVAGFCRTHALLLLKPDAVVARRLLPALDWLSGNGFRVVAAERVALERHAIRALWYFQWGTASAYRRRLADLLATATESLVLLVRPDSPAEIPASVLLTGLKGPTEPDERSPGQLRHTLGRYGYLLNLAHTPDEPADVLRELAIYFGGERFTRVVDCALVGEDRGVPARKLAEQLYLDSAPQCLDFAENVIALLAEVEEVLGRRLVGPDALAELTGLADPTGVQLRDQLGAILCWAWRYGVPLPPWPMIVVGSAVLPMTAGDRPLSAVRR